MMKKVGVAILGLGVVGGGTYKILTCLLYTSDAADD